MEIKREKALAFITTYTKNKYKLLVFEHPITSLKEVIRGTVEDSSNLYEEVLREIEEESGLKRDSFESIKHLDSEIFEIPGGYDRKGPIEKQKHYAYHLTLKNKIKNNWSHIVSGNGIDNGHEYKYQWINLENADKIITHNISFFIKKLKDNLMI